MNNDNSDQKQVAGMVIEGATETSVPFIFTKNSETGDEYLSTGDLVLIKSSNKNKLINYSCIGMVVKNTPVSPEEHETPEAFNSSRAKMTQELVDLGVADVMLQDTFYNVGEIQILQVCEYSFGESNPTSVSDSIPDPFKPDTFVYKLDNLDEADFGTFPTKKFGALMNTNLQIPMIIADNKQMESARNVGVFGGTESGKSQMAALLVDKRLSLDLSMFIVDPKGEFSEEKLPTIRNFKKRVLKHGRDLKILKSENIYLKPTKKLVEEILKGQEFFKGSYWNMTMDKTNREKLIESVIKYSFHAGRNELSLLEKWFSNQITIETYLEKVLRTIQLDNLAFVYASQEKQDELSSLIDDILDSPDKLDNLARQFRFLQQLFGQGEDKYSVNQIVGRVLLNKRSVTVIVPSVSDSFDNEFYDPTEHYELILSKIILSIRNTLDNPMGSFAGIKNYNCALIFDEAQNIFPYNCPSDSPLLSAIKAIRKIAETYRAKGISTWVITPSPKLIDGKLLDRILDHDIYVGSKLTRSGKKIIDDLITDKNVQNMFNRIPKPLKEFNELGNKMKNLHFFCKGMISPLDNGEKGFITRIDLEIDDESDDV